MDNNDQLIRELQEKLWQTQRALEELHYEHEKLKKVVDDLRQSLGDSPCQ